MSTGSMLPGLQVGDLVVAGVFGAWLLLQTALGLGLRLGPGSAAAAVVAMVVLWLAQAVHAGSVARRVREGRVRWLSRPLGLLLFYMATAGVTVAYRPVLKAFVLQTYTVSTGSMLPGLQVGDLVVAVPKARIERGAVVVHSAPRGARSGEPGLKRVVAIGGDTVAVRDGRLFLNGTAAPGETLRGECTYSTVRLGGEWREEACRQRAETLGGVTYRIVCAPEAPCGDFPSQEVPPGHVFLLGDHRDSSADSRYFGPIPEASILGRVRWVSLSFGPDGLRGERFGTEIP